MKYLLDVNVLLACGWADHAEHSRTASWIGGMKKKCGIKLLSSAIPELGFVRVSVQRAGGILEVKDAVATLAGMLRSLKEIHAFLPDNLASVTFPSWCASASRTTGAHLLALAQNHEAELATLNAGIPGAFLLPSLSSRGKKAA